MTHPTRSVFIVSDHTGLTADNIAKAMLAHFPGHSFRYLPRPFITDPALAREVVAEVQDEAERGLRPLVFTTIIQPEVLNIIAQAPGRVFDLLSAGIQTLEKELAMTATMHGGGHNDMGDTEAYTARMNALDFALATDDGVGDRQYGTADVILVGVSRAGKTPTSLFLALTYSMRASNYPLAEDDFESSDLPKPLQLHRGKLFGLTIHPQRLHAIRTQRRPGSQYATIEQCEFEVRQAEKIFATNGIPVRETTSASVEEIAAGVLSHLKRR